MWTLLLLSVEDWGAWACYATAAHRQQKTWTVPEGGCGEDVIRMGRAALFRSGSSHKPQGRSGKGLVAV
jgi:hypothetical protein